MVGGQCCAGLVACAEVLCRERGVRFTAQRRRVLEILAEAPQPMGAYEILAELRRRQRGARSGVAPPTVYRALDFLQQQGLVHRLATLQAFVSCNHPEHSHGGQFLICADCGQVEEIDDAAIGASLDTAASAAGFRAAGGVVEVTGCCSACRSAAGLGSGSENSR